jgi:hypothetical protein
MSRQLPFFSRTFRDLTEAELDDVDGSYLLTRSWHGAIGWPELLRSQRILIVSEAGVGKTYECQHQQQALWDAGEAAFYLDLATLANSSVRAMLSKEQTSRFDAWLRSQADVATFFLDSYDELLLTLGKFDEALKRVASALDGQLSRARIVITTRPVPIDRKLIAHHLPVPPEEIEPPSAQRFADAMMARKQQASRTTGPELKPWRNVGLMPLSNDEMRAFAATQHVDNPDELLADIVRRHAEDFARRPQDLISICADWREHNRIRRHSDQVASNIAIKLRARAHTDRRERAALSPERSLDGASRLALAAILTRKLTLRYNADTDAVEAASVALDTPEILQSWNDDERNTLLERALFGFASYGRVRFHHRSVLEFLAAKRLDALMKARVPISAIKRLLFAETAQGARAVRPSMRPVAAWLALWHDTVFEEVVAREPDVILTEGDPESLRPPQRIKALDAYIARYGNGGWRGLSTPRVQIHRFAGPELSETVARNWQSGVENPEVRYLLLQIIGEGRLTNCVDIAFDATTNAAATAIERTFALRALVQLSDPRIGDTVASLASETAKWPEEVAKHAIIELFPDHLPVAQLIAIVRRLAEPRNSVGDLNYNLPREIETGELSDDYLDQLREGLSNLLREGLFWSPTQYPHRRTPRPYLIPALLAACRRQAASGVRSHAWVMSSLLAIRLSSDSYSDDKEQLKAVRAALAELSPDQREAAFWAEDALLESVHLAQDLWHRIFELAHHGGIQLNSEQDGAWVRKCLWDKGQPLDHREMMLWVEMTLLLWRPEGVVGPSFDELKSCVADAPTLVELIERRSRPQPPNPEHELMEAEHTARVAVAAVEDAEAHASWVRFWHEIQGSPEIVFDESRAENTAWNLWRAMAQTGSESRSSGWNRRYIESEFGKDIADRLRAAMCPFWRKDRPTLRSERPADEKGRYLVRWQFGLACIAAEAEDSTWAKHLSHDEAMLACRYVPLELNRLPSWLGGLASEHPTAVDAILGEELSKSLSEEGGSYSMLLQDIRHGSPEIAKLFAPRLRSWLEQSISPNGHPTSPSEQNLSQAVRALLKYGDANDRDFLKRLAEQALGQRLVTVGAETWMVVLFRLDPIAGMTVLEQGLADERLPEDRKGVFWLAKLFGSLSGDEDALNPRTLGLSPDQILRLLRLAYREVPVAGDRRRAGVFAVDERDSAERARNNILNALLEMRGNDAWKAKLEMANDPIFAHFKDRAIALAEESAAEDADRTALSERDFVQLDTHGEASPATAADMFALMRDRLDDIDDLLLRDISPRELWAGITDEYLLRRELARELNQNGNGVYTADQEAVTADENETDIRLRVAVTGQQGTIELKIGDKPRSAAELRSALRDQLLTKYMAAEQCRAGILVISLAEDKKWQHPETRARLDFAGLIAFLREEANKIVDEFGGAARIAVWGLDLRPRLKPASRRSRKSKAKTSTRKTKRQNTKARQARRSHRCGAVRTRRAPS